MYPDAKVLWVDAHIDANTPDTSPSKNMHGMPLAYLSGMVPFQKEWKCLDMAKDICYFGIRSYEPEEHDLIKEKGVLVFESKDCLSENITSISNKIDHHFKSKLNNCWVSFDIDGIDSREFKSTGTAEEDGLTIDFMNSFFKKFGKKTVGMDLTEVNFELAPNQ